MARVKFVEAHQVEGKAKEAYDNYVAKGKLTNMKQALLLDYATHEAFMGWYTSWNRLVEVIGLQASTIFAHAISTTNSCKLCSLFFISDLKDLGLDPYDLHLTEQESLLEQLGEQIVKDPTAVSDELIDNLKKFYNDTELVIIVGFAAQMIATNNFNSVLQIDVDQRLVPLQDEFKPAAWRNNIK